MTPPVTTAPAEQGTRLDDALFQVCTLDMSRGDTLVLKTRVQLSRLQEERLRRQVDDFLNLQARGIKTLILTAGTDIAVLKTPEGETP